MRPSTTDLKEHSKLQPNIYGTQRMESRHSLQELV
ncbi:hypothetical protein SAMN05444273_11136 [Litoreibacter ascidiaceicola]|uniref:Uncharacterized protein n=1 Tax=Litoreibacter ascidiaceicola TaxID=1486859 RepID=A0A1M5E607_9RHOB|nr:hypothetical protein SAMN05444273_11136 [Litoreibacter ascidiaceicola]